MTRSSLSAKGELAHKASPRRSDDGFGLVQLWVLVRAARGTVSEEEVLECVRRHKVRVTVIEIGRLLSSLVRKGLIRPTSSANPRFAATSQGRKSAAQAYRRLSDLLAHELAVKQDA